MSSVLSVAGTCVSSVVHKKGAVSASHGQLHADVSQVPQDTMMPNADVPWLLPGCLRSAPRVLCQS